MNLIKATGHWPMLEGQSWNESSFDWKKTILSFRKYVSKSDDDIFGKSKELSTNIIEKVN